MPRIERYVVKQPITISETATLAEAARLMTERGVGSLVVMHLARTAGLITERDVLTKVAAGADPGRTPVKEALQAQAASVSPRATERECAELMQAHHTRHLAVVEDGQVVGVFSMLDLVRLTLLEKQWNIDQLESFIRGGRSSQLSQPITGAFGVEPAHAGA
jgi:CBS domain-containing protein